MRRPPADATLKPDAPAEETDMRGHGLSIVILTLLAATAASARTNKASYWPETGYGAGQTGYNPHEKSLSTSNVGTLQRSETFYTGGQIVDSIPVSNGIAYVNSQDGNLYAVDLSTGQSLWTFNSDGGADWPTGVVLKGTSRAFVSCLDPNNDPGICALNAQTGNLLWSVSLQDNNYGTWPLAPPAISGNVVYFEERYQTYGNYLFALNAKTGATLWDYAECSTSGVCVHLGDSPPTIAGGYVYVDCSGGSGFTVYITNGVCAFNASNGQLAWQYQTGDGNSRIAAAGGNVYAAAGTSPVSVLALNGSTGTLLWSVAVTGTETENGPPAIKGNMLYVSTYHSNSNNLVALNASTGATVWAQTTAVTTLSSPSIPGGSSKTGVLFTACQGTSLNGSACAFSLKTGDLLWQSSDPGTAGIAPELTNGALFDVCGYDNLCIYTPSR
jgi:outer membrane protein assembly factor BamB